MSNNVIANSAIQAYNQIKDNYKQQVKEQNKVQTDFKALITGANSASDSTKVHSANSSNMSALVKQVMQERDKIKKYEAEATKVASDNGGDDIELVTSANQAKLAVSKMVEIKNKLVKSFEEIYNMNI